MKYFKDSRVLRIENNNLKIIWNIEDDVEISIFSLIGNCEELIGKVKGKNEFITKDYYKNKRCLFILKAENYHYEIVGERLINLEGAHQFRDIGGYKSEDGRRVRWGVFYRSDRLCNLTSDDIRYIRNMKVKTILDLRCEVEVRKNPDPKIREVNYINLAAMKRLDKNNSNLDMISLFSSGAIDNIDIEDFILNYYKNMIHDNLALKKLIESIENGDGLPIIFHSSSGKDRAGLFSIIILSILSVPRKIIKDDFLASNIYSSNINKNIFKKFEESIKNEKKLRTLKCILEVKEEYIDAVFDEIDKTYGSLDNYLEKEYGLTRKKRKELKNRFLY